MSPRLNCAPAFPFSTAFFHHFTASASLCFTPWPSSYTQPRLPCAALKPWSAAVRHPLTAASISLCASAGRLDQDALPCFTSRVTAMYRRVASSLSCSAPAGSGVRHKGQVCFTPNFHNSSTHFEWNTWVHCRVVAGAQDSRSRQMLHSSPVAAASACSPASDCPCGCGTRCIAVYGRPSNEPADNPYCSTAQGHTGRKLIAWEHRHCLRANGSCHRSCRKNFFCSSPEPFRFESRGNMDEAR